MKTDTHPVPTSKSSKQTRLAAKRADALRANLKKRKEQAAAREQENGQGNGQETTTQHETAKE